MFTENPPSAILFVMADVTSLEQKEQGEIELPPNLTQALGNYLSQEIAPQLAKIGEGISNLPENSKGIEEMKRGRERIKKFLDGLESAEKVSLTREDEFKFFGQRKEKTLKPGVITADQKLTHKLVRGLNDVIGNPLSSLFGFSEHKYPQIHAASSKILQVMDIFRNAQGLRITIDKSGRPTLKTIPHPNLAK